MVKIFYAEKGFIQTNMRGLWRFLAAAVTKQTEGEGFVLRQVVCVRKFSRSSFLLDVWPRCGFARAFVLRSPIHIYSCTGPTQRNFANNEPGEMRLPQRHFVCYEEAKSSRLHVEVVLLKCPDVILLTYLWQKCKQLKEVIAVLNGWITEEANEMHGCCYYSSVVPNNAESLL